MSEARAQILEAQIQKAKIHPHRTGVLRRETLNALISSSRSGSSKIKALAARNIQYFFKDFPELEEHAINAIYDLCEDQSPQVRIEGYKAISGISRAERRWIKSNADVLLQLLQSDEPEEVTVVKSALIEHLELDVRITLGVLCDQLTPIDSAMDEEERTMRARLRTLVLAFLVGEALTCVARHAKPNSPSEDILLESILGVIPHLEHAETAKIVNALTSALPSYSAPSPKGEALFQVLLNRVSTAIRSDMRGSRPASLLQARLELRLAQQVVLTNKITSPLGLLRYYDSLTGNVFLQQLAKEEQRWLVGKLGEGLSFAHKNYPGDREILTCQWKFVDACPYLLEILIPTMLETSSGACSTLLRACLQRKNSQDWTISPNLAAVLEKMRVIIDKAPIHEDQRDLQKMIMFLLPTTVHQLSQVPAKQPLGRAGKVMKPSTRRISLSLSQPSKDTPRDQSQPPAKRKKSTDDGGLGEPPKLSLLSRLQLSIPESTTPPSSTGLSIKGAAGGGNASPPKKAPLSLLERLQDVGDPTSSGSLGVNSPRSDPRKRKRGNR